MSIPLLPHSNFLIQSLQSPCFPFSQGKVSIQIQKETEFKKTTNAITQNKKEPRTSSTKHKQTRTKRNSHFHTPIPPFQPKNSSKVFTHAPSPEAPKTIFPKRKYICPQTLLRFLSNVKEFFLKRFGVFFQILRHFGSKLGFSGQFSRIFFSRFIQIPVFIQETPPLQAF